MICGAAEAQNAYKYTEPKDSIVRIFWEEIKQLPAITKAEAYDKALYDNAVQFKSKTEMSFDFVPENVDSSIFAQMKMRCYQMLDGGWVAVLDIDFHGKQLSKEDTHNFHFFKKSGVHWKNFLMIPCFFVLIIVYLWRKSNT